jgi:hypothetical protein
VTTTIDKTYIDEILTEWSEYPREGAYTIIGKYGLPHEATPSMLIWHTNTPWKRTIVYRDEIPHNFPAPHPDFLEQSIAYQVPLDSFNKLAMFDGSIIIDRTAGRVSARCHQEAMNILTLNLMHDVITGKRSVDEARSFYSETAVEYSIYKKPSPYTEEFQFQLPENDTADPDEKLMMQGMIKEEWDRASDKVRDFFEIK